MTKREWGVALFVVAVYAFVAWLLGACDKAYGFPEMARKGYQGCDSCHVQRSGGGALTAYGRMISHEALSSWNVAALEPPELPSWLDLGADYRWLTVTAPGYHAKFPMQLEAEGVLHPLPGIDLAGTAGIYGPQKRHELRRNYLQAALGPFKARVGKFTPAFGVNDPDHTLWTRQAFNLGQGRDQYMGEASYQGAWGEAILGHSWGSEAGVQAGGDYRVNSYAEAKAYARLAAYVAEHAQLGASAVVDEHGPLGHGFHGFAAYGPFYTIAEVSNKYRAVDPGIVAMAKIGVETCQGFHILGSYETYQKNQRLGYGLQWYPAPGLDLLLRLRRDVERPAAEVTAVIHAYL